MKITLCGIVPALVAAWRQQCPGVEIYEGSILDLEVDIIVSPANSFGFMDGGIDLQYRNFFGMKVEADLQRRIKEYHSGELLVGEAELVATGHRQIPYVIAAPTMRVPMILGRDSVNVYLATRAALRLAHSVESDGTINLIKSIAFPGMGTGVGRVPPESCARQMRRAIEDWYVLACPGTWYEAQQSHVSLFSDKPHDLQID